MKDLLCFTLIVFLCLSSVSVFSAAQLPQGREIFYPEASSGIEWNPVGRNIKPKQEGDPQQGVSLTLDVSPGSAFSWFRQFDSNSDGVLNITEICQMDQADQVALFTPNPEYASSIDAQIAQLLPVFNEVATPDLITALLAHVVDIGNDEIEYISGVDQLLNGSSVVGDCDLYLVDTASTGTSVLRVDFSNFAGVNEFYAPGIILTVNFPGRGERAVVRLPRQFQSPSMLEFHREVISEASRSLAMVTGYRLLGEGEMTVYYVENFNQDFEADFSGYLGLPEDYITFVPVAAEQNSVVYLITGREDPELNGAYLLEIEIH
jgi:hypothetical protein